MQARTRLCGALLAVCASAALLAGAAVPTAAGAASVVEEGKKLVNDRRKGNCVSCHAFEGANLPGNIGPPLVAMKQRFPDKSKLRAQVWDATVANPQTMMPPFGSHEILSADEIDKIVEFLYTL